MDGIRRRMDVERTHTFLYVSSPDQLRGGELRCSKAERQDAPATSAESLLNRMQTLPGVMKVEEIPLSTGQESQREHHSLRIYAADTGALIDTRIAIRCLLFTSSFIERRCETLGVLWESGRTP